MDENECTITYILGTITNSSPGNQLPLQANKNVWIMYFNWEEQITTKGALEELQLYQYQRVNIK